MTQSVDTAGGDAPCVIVVGHPLKKDGQMRFYADEGVYFIHAQRDAHGRVRCFNWYEVTIGGLIPLGKADNA